MGISLEDSARHLWRTAPWWRVSVVAAVAFTVAWLGHLEYLALGNPGSDARLAAYVSAWRRAEGVAAPGEKCEQIARAFAELGQEDVERGGANGRWEQAVREGESCSSEVDRSDSRFAGLAQAVSAAATNVASVQPAADALKSLDAFDRSRKRFREEAAVVAKAEGYVTAVAASDRRLASLAGQTAAFGRSRSPADALGVVQALNELTGLDRVRSSSGSRQETLAAAEAADSAVLASRAKLSRLPETVGAAENTGTEESERRLVGAIAAVTPFDEGVATLEQRHFLVHARAAASDLAWRMLRQGLAAVGQRGAPSDYEAVVMPYGFLKNTPPGSLSGDQRVLLAKAGVAADALAASDARLAGLLKVDGVWRQRGVAAGDAVSSALAAVTPFDKSRFDDAHKQAWQDLSRAKIILDGPKLGFTAGTKVRMQIFVAAADKSAATDKVVDAVNGALGRAGFEVASDRRDAALVAAVTVESVDDPKPDLNGGFLEWVSTARIGVRAFWAADDKPLFSDELVETGRTRDKGAAQAQALLAGVGAILDRFTKAAER